MSLARTALLRGRNRTGSARDEFDRLTRALLHAKHAAGAAQEELKALRHEWRALYQKVRNEAPSEGSNHESAGGTRLDLGLAVADAHEQPSARLTEEAPRMAKVLREFVDTIVATGGLVRFADRTLGCAGDEEWIDLAQAAMLAQQVLNNVGIEVKIPIADADETGMSRMA